MKRPGKAQSANDDDKVVYVTSDGGVKKLVTRDGVGEEVPSKAFATVHYVLTLEDGTVIDSSRKRNSPFQFQVNGGQVILGWDKAVRTMKKGEQAKVTIASDYGYGSRQMGPIPANSTLFFDIEVIDYTMEQPSKSLVVRLIQFIVILGGLYMLFNYLYPRVERAIENSSENN